MIVGFEDRAKAFFDKYKMAMFWTAMITFFTHIYFFMDRLETRIHYFPLKDRFQESVREDIFIGPQSLILYLIYFLP